MNEPTLQGPVLSPVEPHSKPINGVLLVRYSSNYIAFV